MIGSLFTGGFGQYIAPDPTAEELQPPNKSSGGGIWQIIAPDPNYSSVSANPNESDQCNENTITDNEKSPETPIKHHSTSSLELPVSKNLKTESTPASFLRTPEARSSTPSKTPSKQSLESALVEAATSTLNTLSSPTPVWDSRKIIFQICSNNKPSEKNLKKLTSSLMKDVSLATCRCAGMAPLVPDGFSPLHAAAAAGNVKAANILLNLEYAGIKPVSALTIDILGRTPLHVAAENGHLEVVAMLKNSMMEEMGGVVPVGIDAPVDLIGRTPLAWALTSSLASAKKNRTELEKELLVEGDSSICPKTPVLGRGSTMKLEPKMRAGVVEYGVAEMPGRRVEMEDAIMIHPEKGLFGVFDGHGDGGYTARFLKDNLLKEWLEEEVKDGENLHEILENSCKHVDESLKTENNNREGGSTGIVAIITIDTIFVGNVGDSRAILIQKNADEVKVIAMSNDHKPNLPAERDRAEKAGFTVITEKVEALEGNKETEIHKIQHPKTSAKIAVSRAFGDHDYKSNKELEPQKQALIAIPETCSRKREFDDLYLILACDGIWDVMSNIECAQFVMEQDHGISLVEIGDNLLKECLKRGSEDNMSVVVVGLKEDRTVEKTLNFDD